MEDEVQLVGVLGIPLNETVLDPCDVPKFDPDIVTIAPTGPELGESEEIEGGE